MTPSSTTVFIAEEMLTLVAKDTADLGRAEMLMAEWSMTVGASFGGVARALAGADVQGFGPLREAALRLGADVIALVEQIDHDSGRAAEMESIVIPPDIPATEMLPLPDEPADDEDHVVRHVDFGHEDVRQQSEELDTAAWNGERWRAHLRNAGIRVADAVRAAQQLARQFGEPEPGTLDEVRSQRLSEALRGWTANQAVPV